MNTNLASYIQAIPDFPVKGVLFRDVTSLLASADGFQLALDGLCAQLKGISFDLVAGMESRGFLFGAPLAYRLHKPFVPIRKPGKLPREVIQEEYHLEYGTARLEIHKKDLFPGSRVVIVDDLLATGGTAQAAAHLVERLEGIVTKMLFVIELEGFHARTQALASYSLASLVRYDGT